MQLTKILAWSLAATVLLCSPAWGQDQERPERGMRQRRMPQLAPEKAEAAWQWQSKEVAHDLKLESEKSESLVKIYVASRKHLNAAAREAMEQRRAQREAGEQPEPGDRPGRGRGFGFGADPQLIEEARAALGLKVEALLGPEQAKKAVASLGTFNRQWDRMTDAILGLELETGKTYAALAPIRQYVVETGRLRESGDRETMFEGMREARDTLTERLGDVLDDEQLEQFREATSRRRGGPQGGGRGPEGGGRP